MATEVFPAAREPGSTAEPALVAEGLAKSFGTTQAVRAAGFTLPRGASFALVGPDGAGKSTTMRLLCGLLSPDAGTVRVFGKEPRNRAAKRRMGYLSQQFSLYADLSVDENIAFFAEIHGVRDYAGRRDRLLDFLRLLKFRDRAAGKLSGGMKQKLALACSLVHEPDLLLMDEPTTGVDPVSRREFWDILGSLLADGLSLVVTTPYLDEAERCAEIALMTHGSFLAQGSPAELKARLPYQVVELLCADARKAAKALAGLTGIAGTQTFGDRVDILVSDVDAGLRDAEAALDAAGLVHGSGRRISPTLENLFLHLLDTEAPAA